MTKTKSCLDICLPLAFSTLLLMAASASAAPDPGSVPTKDPASEAETPKNAELTTRPPAADAKNAASGKGTGTQGKGTTLEQLNAHLDARFDQADSKLENLRAQLEKVAAAQITVSSDAAKLASANEPVVDANSSSWTREIAGQRVLGIDLAVLLIALILGPLTSWLMTRATLRNAGLL